MSDTASDARARARWNPAKVVCPECGRLVDDLEHAVLADAVGRSERRRLCAACVAALPHHVSPRHDGGPDAAHSAGPPLGGPYR